MTAARTALGPPGVPAASVRLRAVQRPAPTPGIMENAGS